MKKRVKTDSAILHFVIILTGLLYAFPGIYLKTTPVWLDDGLDFIGFFVVLTGTFLRMVSRGFKKEHSQKGAGLVTGGPYALTRNPMYLGSFLMGAGFVFMVWPWWGLPVFAWLFYLRFRKQIVQEETQLNELFGEEYRRYRNKVPRIFPRRGDLRRVDFAGTFPWVCVWNTNEKRALGLWPVMAVLLETFQERVVFGITDIGDTIKIFAVAAAVFAIALAVAYKKKARHG